MTRLALILALLASPALSQSLRIIDGDTFEVDGESYRIPDFDSPETWKPKCEAERALGRQATAALRQWVGKAARIEYQRTGEMCGYQRPCALLFIDGRDVRAMLIQAGLGAKWDFVNGRATTAKPDWCAGGQR